MPLNTASPLRSSSTVHKDGSPCECSAWLGRAVLPGELSCGKQEQGTAFLGLWLSGAGKRWGRIRAPAAVPWPYKDKARYFPSQHIQVRPGRTSWDLPVPRETLGHCHTCSLQTYSPTVPSLGAFQIGLIRKQGSLIN